MSNSMFPIVGSGGTQLGAREQQPQAGHPLQACPAAVRTAALPGEPFAGRRNAPAQASAWWSSSRCSVRGCVFPAIAGTLFCRYHHLLQSDAEAELFQSRQPSALLALYAPFGVADHDPDDSRHEDRKRQASERKDFILDEPA